MIAADLAVIEPDGFSRARIGDDLRQGDADSRGLKNIAIDAAERRSTGCISHRQDQEIARLKDNCRLHGWQGADPG